MDIPPLEFVNSRERTIGRCDVLQFVGLDENRIIMHKDDYVLLRIRFPMFSPNVTRKVPTGIVQYPRADSPDEYILCNGQNWYFAEHRIVRNSDDSDLYIKRKLPDRVAQLTTADQFAMQNTIDKYFKKLADALNED